MKQKIYVVFAATFFCLLRSYSQTPLMLDVSSAHPSNAVEDANGDIGIGATTIYTNGCGDTYLKLLRNTGIFSCSGGNPDFLTAAHVSGSTEITDFVVKTDGKVGIGIAEPEADLHIKCKNWYDEDDLLNSLALKITDPAGNMIGAFANGGTSGGGKGGAFVVAATADLDFPALGVINFNDNIIDFAVLGNGMVGMGIDISGSSGFTPEAQVSIVKNNPYDYILKAQNPDQNHDYFDIDNDGHISVGMPTQTGVTATLYEASTDTKLDLMSTSTTHNAIRFGQIASVTDGHSVMTPRHQITEASGDLVIDPGLSGGGGNDKLKVDGNEEITGYLSVGLGTGADDFRAPSVLGSTLALHHIHTDNVTGPTLDFFQEDDITGWNGQIRFGRKYNDGTPGDYDDEQCTMRHIIADNYTTGELDIQPGVETDPDKIGSANHLTNIVHIKGRMVVGDKKITATPHDNAQLFVDGKIAAKYVVVTESNWADHVFNSDYALRSLPDLENYIIRNHHLPEVPTECEVEKKGVNVGEMNATLLKKIEELTLYVLAQQKQMDKMKEQLNVLSNH